MKSNRHHHENIPCNTDIDIGTLVVGMVCDTLSGRSPLYQVEDFIAEQDTELLFGARVDSRGFNDDALGNASDNKLNNEELQRISKLMRPLENNISEILYIADCKLITPDNMGSSSSSSAFRHACPFVVKTPKTKPYGCSVKY